MHLFLQPLQLACVTSDATRAQIPTSGASQFFNIQIHTPVAMYLRANTFAHLGFSSLSFLLSSRPPKPFNWVLMLKPTHSRTMCCTNSFSMNSRVANNVFFPVHYKILQLELFSQTDKSSLFACIGQSLYFRNIIKKCAILPHPTWQRKRNSRTKSIRSNSRSGLITARCWVLKDAKLLPRSGSTFFLSKPIFNVPHWLSQPANEHATQFC